MSMHCYDINLLLVLNSSLVSMQVPSSITVTCTTLKIWEWPGDSYRYYRCTWSYSVCLNVTCTGVERLDVVQVSHWKLAEMTGEAKRNTRSSESL